jgi:hypothetical protein
MAQRPLRKHTCECCKRNFFSRSNLSRFCGVHCQVKTWRANNKFTHEQREEQFIAQEMENNALEQGVA